MHSVIIRSITTFIIPYILIYAFYIQVNGEISPGGGFQFGAIFASSIIALDIVSINKKLLSKYFSLNILITSAYLGVIIYTIVGVISIILDMNYLNYSVFLKNNPVLGQSIGIFSIEIGVGITVATIMILIYLYLKE